MSDRYLTAYDLVDAEAREAWARERPDWRDGYDPSDDYDPDLDRKARLEDEL